MDNPTNEDSPTVVIVRSRGPGCLVRALYFIFIGWWVAALWILAAWALNVTIVGLPLGLLMLNRVPQVMTLSPGSQDVRMIQSNGILTIAQGSTQFPIWARALYFVGVGWWASLIWTVIAYFLAVFPFTWPLGFAMFNIIGFVTTLRKN